MAEPKVTVQLMAVGGAPRFKQSKFKLAGDKQFAFVIGWLRKNCGKETIVRARGRPTHGPTLLLGSRLQARRGYRGRCTRLIPRLRPPTSQVAYCNSAFSPAPDALISDLHAVRKHSNPTGTHCQRGAGPGRV